MLLIALEIVAGYQFEDKSNHLAADTTVAHTAADTVIVDTVVVGIVAADIVAADMATDMKASTIAIAVT